MQEKHVSLFDTSLGSNSDISQNIINGRQEWQHTVACQENIKNILFKELTFFSCCWSLRVKY
jgi:hypothetical protein